MKCDSFSDFKNTSFPSRLAADSMSKPQSQEDAAAVFVSRACSDNVLRNAIKAKIALRHPKTTASIFRIFPTFIETMASEKSADFFYCR